MKLMAFNVIRPLAGRQRKHSVRLAIVMAETAEEGARLVAQDEHNETSRILFRNDWEPGEVVTWSYQTWGQEMVAESKSPTVAEILAAQPAEKKSAEA